MDDVFNALDARTATTIYKRVFDKSDSGFFKQLNSAVILTTTSGTQLRAPYKPSVSDEFYTVDNRLAADQLLLLDEHGNSLTHTSNSGVALTHEYTNTLRQRVNPDDVADDSRDKSPLIETDLASDKEVTGDGLSYCSYFNGGKLPLVTLALFLTLLLASTESLPGKSMSLVCMLEFLPLKCMQNCTCSYGMTWTR